MAYNEMNTLSMADPDPPGPPSGGLCREIETTLYYYYSPVVLSVDPALERGYGRKGDLE